MIPGQFTNQTDPLEPEAKNERRKRLIEALKFERALEEQRAAQIDTQIEQLEELRSEHEYNAACFEKAIDEVEGTIDETDPAPDREDLVTS